MYSAGRMLNQVTYWLHDGHSVVKSGVGAGCAEAAALHCLIRKVMDPSSVNLSIRISSLDNDEVEVEAIQTTISAIKAPSPAHSLREFSPIQSMAVEIQ